MLISKIPGHFYGRYLPYYMNTPHVVVDSGNICSDDATKPAKIETNYGIKGFNDIAIAKAIFEPSKLKIAYKPAAPSGRAYLRIVKYLCRTKHYGKSPRVYVHPGYTKAVYYDTSAVKHKVFCYVNNKKASANLTASDKVIKY